MKFSIIASAIAFATSAVAAPAMEAREADPLLHLLKPPYSGYDAYGDCMGKGLGDYVAWGSKLFHTYGTACGDDLIAHGKKPLKELTKGPVFCCQKDPFIEIGVNLDFLNIIEVEKRIAFNKLCKPIYWGL